MADFLRYVDTDVAPGGVGSEVDPFASLNEAEAACQSLGVSGDTVYIYCKGVTADNAYAYFDGWVAGVDCVIEGENTTGKWDASKYSHEVTGVLTVFSNNLPCTLNNFQTEADNIAWRQYSGTLTINNSISKCALANGEGLVQARGDDGIILNSCILIGSGLSGSFGINNKGGPTLANHCVIYNFDVGPQSWGPDVSLVNCAIVGCTNDTNGNFSADHCASEDGDGTNPITGLTWADEFTDHANGDFSLKSGSNLIGVGATGTGVTEDITGATRPSPPSVGAFEYISGGGGTTLTIADVGQGQVVDVTTLGHLSPIALADIAQGQNLDGVPVAQSSPLTAADVDQNQSISSSVLTQLHGLSTASINQPQTIQQVSLAIAGGLTIANIDQGQGISSATLAQASQVIAATIGQSQSVDSISIDQLHTLITSAVAQAQSLDTISLIVPGGLTIASINQTQTVASINASQLAQLVLDNINQAQGIEAVVVSVPGSPITIANVGQPQSVAQVVAGQITGLLVDGIDQGQSINNINFSIANGRLIIEFAGRAPEVSFEARRPEIKFS